MGAIGGTWAVRLHGYEAGRARRSGLERRRLIMLRRHCRGAVGDGGRRAEDARRCQLDLRGRRAPSSPDVQHVPDLNGGPWQPVGSRTTGPPAFRRSPAHLRRLPAARTIYISRRVGGDLADHVRVAVGAAAPRMGRTASAFLLGVTTEHHPVDGAVAAWPGWRSVPHRRTSLTTRPAWALAILVVLLAMSAIRRRSCIRVRRAFQGGSAWKAVSVGL